MNIIAFYHLRLTTHNYFDISTAVFAHSILIEETFFKYLQGLLNHHINTSVNDTMKGRQQTFEKVRKTVFLAFVTLIGRSNSKSSAISNSIQISFQLFKARSTKAFKKFLLICWTLNHTLKVRKHILKIKMLCLMFTDH